MPPGRTRAEAARPEQPFTTGRLRCADEGGLGRRACESRRSAAIDRGALVAGRAPPRRAARESESAETPAQRPRAREVSERRSAPAGGGGAAPW